MNQINESIFREYDIRGIVADELQDDVVERIALAMATIFVRENKHRIVLARDGRPSSQHLQDIMARQLADCGLHIIDIGLAPTPLMYYTVFKLDLDGGVVITASHNPAEYNGFKLLLGHEATFGDQIKEIYRIAEAGKFPPRKPGRIESREMLQDYIDFICQDIHLPKKIKVVVDGGNGTGGISALPLYRKLGAEVIELFCDVDGTFPNHHPDPTKPENLKFLLQKVRETDADLGIGLDGDADRIGVVDKFGNILWGDILTLIFAKEILSRRPGEKIISEVKASEVLYSEVKRLGGIPIMWKTGHSLLKKKIQQENAALAGEMSGHIFFKDRWFGFDDAVYSGARLMEILANSPKTLTQIYSEIPKAYNTPEIRVDTTEAAKFPIVSQVVAHFKKEFDVIDIDGARIKFPNGWALVRASNTQPALVVRFEADSPAHLQEIQNQVEPILNRIKSATEKQT